MRRLGIAAFWISLAALVGTLSFGGPARAGVARQEGTPAASPAAPPAAPAATDVVTLVAWYALDPSEQFLNVYPLAVDQGQQAGPGGDPIGRADFPEGDFPTLSLGDSQFASYLRFEGDVPERWTWFNDAEGDRPATLVLQVSSIAGPYENYFGTATFVSLDEDVPSSGVLTLALQPPDAGVDDGAAAEEDQGEAAATEAPAAATEAPAEEVGEATESPAEAPAPTQASQVDIATAAPTEEAPADAAPTEEPADEAEPTEEPS